MFSFHPLGNCLACTLYFSHIYLSSILFLDLAYSMNVFNAHSHPSSSGLSLFYVFCATAAKLGSGSKFGDLSWCSLGVKLTLANLVIHPRTHK
jgi:hypothetical protein